MTSDFSRRRRQRGGASGFARRLASRLGTFWTLVILAVAVALAVMIGLAVKNVYAASTSGRAGEKDLLRAISDFDAATAHPSTSSAQLKVVADDVRQADSSFGSMRQNLHSSNPVTMLGRNLPFVRVQVQAANVLADVGQELSSAALTLVGTADRFDNPTDPSATVSNSMAELQSLYSAVGIGVSALNQADSEMSTLSGKRLIGPLGAAQVTLFNRIPELVSRAKAAQSDLRAFIVFAGGTAPQRYLFFSQNPDEVRPTGGFMGTYGVLTATQGHIHLESYGDIIPWFQSHPSAQVPQASAPTALQILQTGQTMANANALPDWPTDAQVASRLWVMGGEAPVNGVLSVTPAFMAAVVGVLGPVQVPSYGETINSSNLLDRVDYWTHQADTPQIGGRKAFVTELAKVVMNELETAPRNQLEPLARAIGASFARSEAMAWTSNSTVEAALVNNGWEHSFPKASAAGDFFYDSEFEFAAKNGRGLHRTFTHTVTLSPDGSGDAATTMVLDNTEPISALNHGDISYVVDYGPGGATLAKGSDQPYYTLEPTLAGHPVDDWLLDADQMASATTKVVFHDPTLLGYRSPGHWIYYLDWPYLPGHPGDVLNLIVVLPKGWKWDGPGPPKTIKLTKDVVGSWNILAP